MRKGHTIFRGLAAAMVLGICANNLSGCATSVPQEVPELLEPVSINEAYRPVGYGDVGNVRILFGTVVPMDYYAYYRINIDISSFAVELGDYVEKGDILAYADIEQAKKQLEDQKQAIEYEETVFSINQEIADLQIKQLQYQKEQLLLQQDTGAEADHGTVPGDNEELYNNEELNNDKAPDKTDEVSQYDIQIATMQENKRYDELLHNYRIEKMKSSLADIQKVVDDGTLRASHAGRISYLKDIETASSAVAGEIVAMISDETNPYIQLEDVNVQEYIAYKKCEVAYMMVGSTRYDIEEMDYSVDELVLCKANNQYPMQRICCPKNVEMGLGESYPFFYQKKDVRDVLVVGNDSLYEENDMYFVYVLDENGERQRREITIGEADDNYTQVVSGLEAGELVYYSTSERMPANYSTYEVGVSDFSIHNQTMTYEVVDETSYVCASEQEGTLEEVCVTKGQQVKAGDLLYVLRTTAKKAALLQAENSIAQEAASYADTAKYYADSIAALENQENKTVYDECALQILQKQSSMVDMNHEKSAQALQEAYDALKKGNDGTGKVSVYATKSGTIGQVEVASGDTIQIGQRMMTIQEKAKEKLQLRLKKDPNSSLVMYEDNVADFGESVCMSFEGVEYNGVCIGFGYSPKKKEQAYVCTDEEGTLLLSMGQSKYAEATFFVALEDESQYESIPKGKIFSYSYKEMKSVIVLPNELIHTEQRAGAAAKHFVWKLVDGEIVKQYIVIDETNLSTYTQSVVLSGLKAGDILAVDSE